MCEESEFFNKFPVEAMRFIWEKLDYDDARNLAETCSKLRKSYFQNENYVRDPVFDIQILYQNKLDQFNRPTGPVSSTVRRFVRNGKMKSGKYLDIKFTCLREAFEHLKNWKPKSILIKTYTLDGSLAYVIARNRNAISVEIIEKMTPSYFHFREATSWEIRKHSNSLDIVSNRLEIEKCSKHYDELSWFSSYLNIRKHLISLELNIHFEFSISDPVPIPNEKKIELCQLKLGYLSKYFSFSQSGSNVIIKIEDLKKCRDSLLFDISDTFLTDVWC